MAGPIVRLPRRGLRARSLGGALALAFIAFACPARAVIAPPDFAIENAASGASFNNPTAIAFTPDGRLLVAEKRGVVRVVQNGVRRTTPMWSGETEVLSNGDRGLLGIAVDPDFVRNHFVYLLVIADPDSDGVDNDDDAFGRLLRFRTSAADSNVLDPASRTVLIGRGWSDGFASGGPSHSGGALRFGADGSLFVAFGDGAQYSFVDAGGNENELFQPGHMDRAQDIGAFRAQDLASLNGKILRVNPATGQGYPSNPFWDGNPASNRSRVWVYGCRNPFRFAVRPGTGAADPTAGDPGTLFIGDVGWGRWDEVDVSAHGGENWGWPCYEGANTTSGYFTASPAHHDCRSIGTPVNPRVPSLATLAMSLEDPARSIPSGLAGRCIIGGVFYEGTSYPLAFRNRWFFADFVNGWIKVATFDAADRLAGVADFAEEAQGPVDFAIHPTTGDVHYVSIESGTVQRIRYLGEGAGNRSPVAVATATPSSGGVPLVVQLSPAGSSDPDFDPLAFAWTFGDGTGSTAPSPSHTYATAGRWPVILTVTDGHGGLARDTLHVVALSAATFPSTAVLDRFQRADGAIGAPWLGTTSGLAIRDRALVQTGTTSYAIWDAGIFGPDQEVHAVFDALTDSSEHDLMLKVQGRSWVDGHIQVHYDTKYGGTLVLTYDRFAGWRRIAGPFPMRLVPGDVFGARATSNGDVAVYHNSVVRGVASVSSWPYAASGGRLGVLLSRARDTRMSRFGGGNLLLEANRRPTATIQTPATGGFYAPLDTVWLSGSGADPEDPSGALDQRWEVDLHHNQHVHPAYVVADQPSTFFVAENHDDGTGVWMRARFIVTDTQGAADTTAVDLHPEIDLLPSPIATVPTVPGTSEPTRYRFTIDNPGRMPAPVSHWRLLAGSLVLAEGDTLVPVHGHVVIERTLPPLLAAGTHDLRAEVDTRGQVWETDEQNNVYLRRLIVVSGPGVLDADKLPRVLALSQAFPNPSTGAMAFTLDLPGAADVGMSVYDIQGREVFHAPRRLYAAGSWTMGWNGKADGGRATPGVYLARVMVGERTFLRRFAMVR